jgi:stage V sporulation protein B
MARNNFLKGAAILGIAGVIVKILGAFYRIPLSNIIKTEGMGYYQTAYPLYVLLLTVSTSGFPVAIAKLVSEKRALGDYKGAFKVFKIAFMSLLIAGLITSLVVFINAKSIVKFLGNENAYYSLIALVPALFFVPIMSVFRGFFQGRQYMVPTALSQIAEQFFRVFIGIVLTLLLLDRGTAIAAGGASFGGSIGAVAGTAVMIVIYLKNRRSLKEEMNTATLHKEEPVTRIIRNLLVIAVPITIGAAIAPIMNTIDTFIVLKRLQSIGYTELEANSLYGQLTGLAQTLVNLPQVFSQALAVSLVPAISEANARKRFHDIRTITASGIRITLLIGLPCGFGLFILATPIINLLYYKNTLETIQSTGQILSVLSFGVIFLTLVQSLTAILQGLGRPFVSVKNLFVGAVIKVVLTYVLTGIGWINIKGAAISTVAAYLIASLLNLMSVRKYTRIKLNVKEIFIKPIVSTLGMTLAAKLTYLSALNFLESRVATMVAIIVAAGAYGILLLVTKTLTYDDFSLLPRGEKIADTLVKLKLINR